MWVFFVFALAVALAFIEAQRSVYSDDQEWRREVRVSIILGGAAAAVDALLPSGGFRNSLEPTIALGVAVFVLDDLLYYISHRMAHRIGFFWASHAVHHSPIRYNLFTGLRQPPTWLLTPAAIAPVILIALGAPLVLVAASAATRGVHHFIIHTERVRRLPAWVEYIFNTPSHHRVHHGVEDYCIDKNYGGVLIIWDRLFGTFAEERAEGVAAYGLVNAEPAGAWQVLVSPWRKLFAQVRNARTLPNRLRVLFGPPAHAHQGVMASPSR